jgi:hypothetical protein
LPEYPIISRFPKSIKVQIINALCKCILAVHPCRILNVRKYKDRKWQNVRQHVRNRKRKLTY